MDRLSARLQTLLEVSGIISSSLRLDRVLEAVIDQGMRALEAEAGTVWLLDREADRLVPVVALGPKGEAVKRMWLRPGEGIAGTVVVEKTSFLVENVRRVPQWAARFDQSSGFTTRSLLCVPLVYRDQAIGALQFINKRGDQLFGQDDLALARALASQAAVAIENSRVFEDQIVVAQENERRRIARDIHDGPAQTLAGLILRVDVCQKLVDSDPARASAELEVLKRNLQESLQEVRGIIFDLRPLALDQLGLVAALRTYLEGIAARPGLATVFTVRGRERRLPPSLEVTLYRLVQEAVSNARKHARATTVAVRLRFGAERVEAVVEDDGVGFDVEAARRQGGDHFGLTGMRERVDLLEGTLDISSQPGRGTRVAFSFPVARRIRRSLEEKSGLFQRKARVS